ncbi:MAG: AAA family ATPase, partial [Proteobacteria bacterium]|nr:AAA family ATPase [Pseudomonadota bacterium]
MNKYFPVGVGSFKELAATSGERQYYFVDKTRFISDFWNSHEKALLITRPRRFGKTLLLDMCKCFFDINGREKNKLLFENLSVAKEHPEFFNKYFGRYPVIFLTLKTIKAKTYEEALDAVHERIIRLIKTEFLYLLESKILSKLEVEDLRDFLTNPLNENKLKNSLLFLSGLLEKHHGQKTIILLDEYDSPIHDAFSVSPSENRYHEVLLNFMSSFIGQTFKDNPYLERGIITGILHISH